MLVRSSIVWCAALCSAPLCAQSDWVRVVVGAAPSPRGEHAMVADLARGRVLLFGGRDANGTVLGDTWTWDGTNWSLRSPAHSPSPRRMMAAAWDAAHARVVIFGGDDPLGSTLADTWAWDGSDWVHLAPAPQPAPPRRAQAGLAAGPSDGSLVLFGGVDDLGTALGDTWIFDGSQWASRTPQHSPSARFGPRLAPDLVRRRSVLYGGFAVGTGAAETWEWDGNDWSLRAAASAPGLRMRHGLAFDAARARVVLHGGTDGVAFALGDTWEWDGLAWIPLSTSASPRPVVDAALAFDPGLDRLLRFGGFDGITCSDACWSHGALQPARVVAFGAGCAGSAGVPRLRVVEFGRPWLGDSFRQVADRMPASAPMVFQAGFSRDLFGGQPLPLALDFLGMTGCVLHASIDALTVAVASGGVSQFDMTVPTNSALIGATFFAQTLVIDPAANSAGVTASNALSFTIGRR
ncbi:MAG: kelch repeat-containing protein [Planctomycetota bacterium]